MDCLNDLNRKERLTVLFVTHDLTLAAKYCTHTALFLSGRVQTGVCQVVLNSEDWNRPTASRFPSTRSRPGFSMSTSTEWGSCHDPGFFLFMGPVLSELPYGMADLYSPVNDRRPGCSPGSDLYWRGHVAGFNARIAVTMWAASSFHLEELSGSTPTCCSL